MIWCNTLELERGLFQNNMVSIFLYFHSLRSLKLKFLIVTIVLQTMQLGRFTNEVGKALSQSPDTTASHNGIRACAKVRMVCIFLVHHKVSSN
jgi:hypothetical protein